MRIVLLLAAGLAVAALLLRYFLQARPGDMARLLRMAGGLALLLAGGGLLYARQFALALPIGLAGWMILRRGAPVRQIGPTGGASGVRSEGLDMTLDHDTGEMDGRILAGRHAGRMLTALLLEELLEAAEDFRGDVESLRLLETYLDRAHPGWREHVHADAGGRQGAPSAAGGMSTQEAYQILGLEQDAGEADVREAHRRLMKGVHPDRGGSAALAAKINEAKDRILGKHL